MKRTTNLLAAISFLLSCLLLQAQSPAKFNYQAVARNNSGATIANQPISVRFTIHDLTISGNTLYQETHNVTTNALGLFTSVIGGGTVVSGSLAGISWISGDKFLQVEIDPAGGSNYTDMGTTQLISVPYALQAKEAESITIYPSGTTNPDKVILSHSPAYPNNGIIYKDATDVLGFQGNGNNLLDLHLNSNQVDINADLKISSGTPGAGKVLTSDASGNASWKSVAGVAYKGSLNTGTVTANTTGLDMNTGTAFTYTKLQDETSLEVELFSRIYGGTFAGGATWVMFELHVDGYATPNGSKHYMLTTATTEYVHLKSVFTGLTAGAHTITVFTRTNNGTSGAAIVDPGAYGGKLLAKEIW